LLQWYVPKIVDDIIVHGGKWWSDAVRKPRLGLVVRMQQRREAERAARERNEWASQRRRFN
jgi:hypothetical protein